MFCLCLSSRCNKRGGPYNHARAYTMHFVPIIYIYKPAYHRVCWYVRWLTFVVCIFTLRINYMYILFVGYTFRACIAWIYLRDSTSSSIRSITLVKLKFFFVIIVQNILFSDACKKILLFAFLLDLYYRITGRYRRIFIRVEKYRRVYFFFFQRVYLQTRMDTASFCFRCNVARIHTSDN